MTKDNNTLTGLLVVRHNSQKLRRSTKFIQPTERCKCTDVNDF